MEELEITEKNFKEEVLSKEKYVLLEFYGTWCMPCKMEAKILDKVEEEHRLTNCILYIKDKFGKNAVLKGIDLFENATARERNNQLGGHGVR